MKRVFIFLLLAGLNTGLQLMADVVEPRDINRQFKVTNIKAFPAYKFFILYTDYYYDMGYKAEPAETVWVMDESVFATSDMDATSPLYAIRRDGSGETCRSVLELGGKEFLGYENISTIVDVVTIVDVTDGLVDYEIKKEIYVYRNGKVKEKKRKPGKGFFPLTGPGDNNRRLYWLLPSISFLMLVFFWLWRRKQKQVYPVTAA